MTIKVKEIKTERDDSEGNKIRNEKGEIIDYKRSENVVKVFFEIGKIWTPHAPDIIEILKQVAECEDKKYPNGLGRNMILLKYIYPIFKEYLDSNGFKPIPSDLEFSQREGK